MLLFGIRLLIEPRELSRKPRTTCYNHNCIDPSGHQCGHHHIDISELGDGDQCGPDGSWCPHNRSNNLKTHHSYFHSHSRYCSQQPIAHKQRNLYGHLHRPIWRRNILGLGRSLLIVSQLYQQRDGHRCRPRCQSGSCAIGSASSSFLEEGSSTGSKLSCPCSCPCHAE